jgi:hypothetical protein
MQHEPQENGRPKPQSFELSTDAWGRLALVDANGHRHIGVDPVRAFPITSPRQGISICSAEGKEILWVENLEDLPQPVRGLLEEALARREFVPVVRRILKINTLTEPSEWEVETDRGRTRFVLNNEDDVRRLDDHRAMVIDAQGIRYLIPDTWSLDAGSRRLLERYL